jgi:predicted ATPase
MNTYQFEKIDIKGYRRLLSVELEMRPLNVVIGQNGIGKTSILEIFSLLSASASGRLRDTISKSGGINDILTCGKADELTFGLEMSVPNHNPLIYSLSLIPKNIGYEIKSESLTQDRGYPDPFIHITSSASDIAYYNPEKKQLEKPNWEHSYLETSLSQVPKMYIP